MKEKVAFLFPGQGSQHVGMGKEFYDQFPQVRELFEEANALLGFDLASLCFYGPEEDLRLTRNTQPALVVNSMVALRLLHEHGIEPAIAAGHSLGEYSALVAAGVLTFSDAVSIVRKRGEFMQEAVPPGVGTMAAIIGLSGEEVEAICRDVSNGGVVQAANLNTPEQVAIAGHVEAVNAAVEEAKRRGAKRTVMLSVSAPFHCQLMKPAADRLAEALKTISVRDPRFPVITNVSAQPIASGNGVHASLVEQVCSPVRWEQSMRYLLDQGIRFVIEIGAGKVLSGLMKRIDKDVTTLNVEDQASLEATLKALL